MSTGELKMTKDFEPITELPLSQIEISGEDYIKKIYTAIQSECYGTEANKQILAIMRNNYAESLYEYQKTTANLVKDNFGDIIGETYLSVAKRVEKELIDSAREKAKDNQQEYSDFHTDNLAIEAYNQARGFEPSPVQEYREPATKQQVRLSFIPNEFKQRVNNVQTLISSNTAEFERNTGTQAFSQEDEDKYIEEYNKARGF